MEKVKVHKEAPTVRHLGDSSLEPVSLLTKW